MSFDVFLSSFESGKPKGISRATIREIFQPHVSDINSSCWQLSYDAQNFCDVYLSPNTLNPDEITSFTVSKPCRDPRLWAALAHILHLAPVALYFPEGRAPLVANIGVAAELPPEMIAMLGEPICVSTGEDIVAEIQKT